MRPSFLITGSTVALFGESGRQLALKEQLNISQRNAINSSETSRKTIEVRRSNSHDFSLEFL